MSDGFSSVHFFELLHVARTRHASDVHVIAGSAPMLRINGSLEPAADQPVSSQEVAEIVRHVFDDSQRLQLSSGGDVTCTNEYPGVGPIRAHASVTSSGVCVALRILDRSIPALDTLGLPVVVQSFVKSNHGLVLIAGPTGCGKTVTLYSALKHLNTTEKNISTVEDPVEIQLKGINQVNINPKIGLPFSTILRTLLRQDPDIIMVGEIRDLVDGKIAE